jgi:hypothetical protein
VGHALAVFHIFFFQSFENIILQMGILQNGFVFSCARVCVCVCVWVEVAQVLCPRNISINNIITNLNSTSIRQASILFGKIYFFLKNPRSYTEGL